VTGVLFTVGEVARVTAGRLVSGPAGACIAGVKVDSRAVGPGDLFVAIPGQRTDGHLFVGDAARRGASAALVIRWPPDGEADPPPGAAEGLAVVVVDNTVAALGRLAASHRRRFAGLRVVGITGSVGKTTTKDMAAAVLARRYRTVATEGNLNTDIGVPLSLFRVGPETEVAVLELAMRGRGQITELAAMAAPQVGVVTNVGESHLEVLGSVEAIARAKAELVEALPPDGRAVLNGDDPWCRWMAERSPAPVLWFGTADEAAGETAGDWVRADRIRTAGARVTFRLLAGAERADVRLPVAGRHNVSNALAAAAVGLALDVPLTDVVRGLASFRPTAMRLEILDVGSLLLINDAYNASPSSTRAALEVLRRVGEGRRRVAVLGDMLELGPAETEAHRAVGREAAGSLDLLITVGRRAVELARGALEAGLPPDAVRRCAQNDDAILELQHVLRPGDAVLVKGSRGMRMEEIVAAIHRRWAGSAERAPDEPGGGHGAG